MSGSRYAPDRRRRLLLTLPSSLPVVAPPLGPAASGDVVISQIFGGGSSWGGVCPQGDRSLGQIRAEWDARGYAGVPGDLETWFVIGERWFR